MGEAASVPYVRGAMVLEKDRESLVQSMVLPA